MFYKCEQEKKANGTAVKDTVTIEKKSVEVKKADEERRAAWKKGSNEIGAESGDSVGTKQFFVGKEVVPVFEEAISSEDDQEGWTTSYAFSSQEIYIDLRTINHAFIQV